MKPTLSKPPALVISLDFELHWGVRDHFSAGHPYRRNLLGARQAIPQILGLFEDFQIAATWATVGLLFAENAAEQAQWSPEPKPGYENTIYDAYSEPVGLDEASDPIHYGFSLIDRIRRTPGQEIGSHTFSHFQCCESGPGRADFQADLQAAIGLARAKGMEIRSLAFPRNELIADYLSTLPEQGVTCYRGRECTWGHSQPRESLAGRLYRWFDSYLPLSGNNALSWREVESMALPYNIRGSRFLRPLSRFSLLNRMQSRRVQRSLWQAAQQNEIYHLWWHPHNFGSRTRESLNHLREILKTFEDCRRHFGMVSMSMGDLVRFVRQT